MMTTITFTDCCAMLGIDPKTLRNWLKRANLPLVVHPTDARLKCLTLSQVQQLATLHGRSLQLPDSLPSGYTEGVSALSLAQKQAQTLQENRTQLLEAIVPLPSSMSEEASLIKQLASLEAKVSTMQEQLTQLALQLLRERELRYEQRLMTLEALVQQHVKPAPSVQMSQEINQQDIASVNTSSKRSLVPAELRARSRVTPLIEYGAQGSYVAVCPQEGVLPFAPDSKEWFDWLATLSSFRFVGKQGRFTAYRKSDRRGPKRGWAAHRYIHGHHYKHYLGVTDHLTLSCLEQMAAKLQAHLASL